VFASRSPTRALATSLPHQDHVYITTEELFRFHNNEFNEIPSKLDFTENPRSFEKHPTPPQFGFLPPKTETKERKKSGALILVKTRQQL